MNTETIDIPQSGIVVREQAQPIERANLSLSEVHDQLAFIRQVMAQEMKEGQDYGKVPGCGDKPGLFQPGAQKLLLTFQLTPHVKKEVLRDLPHPSIFGHREYEFTISVRSKTGREWDGVGTCSTFESKYRYRKSSRKCPSCGKETIYKDKNPPHGFYCWAKKGGCGAKFGPADTTITGQEEGRMDNDNPAEFWNTVRKMAFKRAIVHASINATNTSELWSQDLEDLPQAQSARSEYIPKAEDDDNLSFENAPEPPKSSGKPTQDASKPAGPPSIDPQANKTPPRATEATSKEAMKFKVRAINRLQAAPGGPKRAAFLHYCMSKGWLRAEQEVEEWPDKHVPATAEAFFELGEDFKRFEMQTTQTK